MGGLKFYNLPSLNDCLQYISGGKSTKSSRQRQRRGRMAFSHLGNGEGDGGNTVFRMGGIA